MQKEIYMQCIANYGVLCVPGLLICQSTSKETHALEYFGFALWILSFLFESVADMQKLGFQKDRSHPRDAICNVGLWKYSRHPNYFGEWMVWNSLIVMSLKSWSDLEAPQLDKYLIFYQLFVCSLSMYYCLTVWTGAVPAEYFSVQKRP